MSQTSNNRIAASALASYVHPPAGNTERYLTLQPLAAAGPTLSSFQALKNYAIRDFGSGFPAAEAILTHIVRNKLSAQGQMQRDFWNRLVVLPVRCILRSAQTGETFEASTASSVAGINPEFAASEGALRVREVEDYASKMRDGADLGVPLYVTGAVLNLLGGNAQARSIYMMDGARRLTAAALNRRREMTIWLLLVEDEYARLLEPASVTGLRQHLAGLRWFSNYQSIPLAGLQGERSLNRFGLMDLSLLRDQVVMDFGCNTGQSCLKAVQAGAREVIGIEGMRDTWEGAVQIGQLAGFQNLGYLNVDFNAADFDAVINRQSPERADYSFFFSVYRTKELVQRDRLFHYIIDKTQKGIFFEGHAHPKIDTLEYYDWLFDSFGLSHQFLGNSEGELRPLFFLELGKAKRKAFTPSTAEAVFPPVPKFSEALPPQSPAQPVPSLLSRSVPAWQAVAGSPANTPKAEPVSPSQADRYRVSAIVSTYKNERFIEGRLKDLLAQTLGDQLEIIVVDSGSPENEGAIVRRYQTQHANIHYLRTEQRENVYQAWNRGIRAASGKYVTNANTDDRLRPDALEVLARELDQNPLIALVYADFWITGFENQEFGNHICTGYSLKPDYHPNIMLAGCHIGPQPMWRRSVHNEIGYFDESFFASGDYEFWCRLALRYPMKHVRELLGLYLHNGAGVSNSNLQRSWAEAQRVQDMYRHRFPAAATDLPTGFYFRDAVRPGGYVNIGMVTFNRLEFTKQAIDAVARFTNFPYALTVVDNCSQDGTQDYLKELKRRGVIKNLVLLTENIGVARASNVAWQQEPQADYYLKLDNDIVMQKPDWLNRMVQTVDAIPELAALAYNFEPVSYPLETVCGCHIRPKRDANLGGACYLIPKRAHEALGYWCEDYGLYGEEDHDHSVRLRLAGFLNAYMEDEDIGIHLPGGKAGKIDPTSHQTTDASEQHLHFDYRAWKDQLRHQLKASGGVFERNRSAYEQRLRSLYIPRGAFAGKIGAEIQIFDLDGTWVFHTVSGTLHPSHRTQIFNWIESESLEAASAEISQENGKEFMRVKKTKRLQKSSEQDVLQLCREGDQLLQQAKAGQALQKFDEALRAEPKVLGAHFGRAVCFDQMERLDDEERALQMELSLQPNHVEARGQLKKIDLYRRLGRGPNGGSQQLKIAVLSFDEIHTGCARLRLVDPLMRLSQTELSWAVRTAGKSGVIKEPALEGADLLIVQRLFPAPGTVPQIDKIFQMGKPVVFEMDDLLVDVPASNPNYEFAMMCRPYVLDVISKSHAVTTSTTALRSQLLRWNSNIYVLPNLLDERLWQHVRTQQAGPVVIGFTGTTTHGDDLAMIEEAFSLISQKHGKNVAFHFMGCVTDRLSRLPGATHSQFTPDYESYSQALQSTRMDLAVVPLVDNRFNSCKSNIKWLEFSACGIAGVYSDLTPYNTCIRPGQTGLLAGNSTQDWFNTIDALVSNASLRLNIAQQARQEVLSNYSLASSKLGLYEQTYRSIVAQYRGLGQSTATRSSRGGIDLQICGVDLGIAVNQDPNLGDVVQRVNRALSLGKERMAARIVAKELGHLPEAAKILSGLEQSELTTVS